MRFDSKMSKNNVFNVNKRISPLKAIRLKCLDCTGGEVLQIKTCPAIDCPLWKFRLGIHPFTEKNSKNPFLEPKNFEGKENMEAQQVIRSIYQKEVDQK